MPHVEQTWQDPSETWYKCQDRMIHTTDVNFLYFGLSVIWFEQEKKKIRLNLNIKVFKAQVSVRPKSVTAVFADHKVMIPSQVYCNCMTKLNLIKIYDTQHVMTGSSCCCKEPFFVIVKSYSSSKCFIYGNWHSLTKCDLRLIKSKSLNLLNQN